MTKSGALTITIFLGTLGGISAAQADDGTLSYPPSGAFEYANNPVASNKNKGWTEADRQLWYTTSQGSRFIPLNWLRALEQTNSSAPFLDKTHMDTFGYISSEGELPLGFAIDRWKDADKYGDYSKPSVQNGVISDEWVGINCAACHTGQIKHQGKRYIIHGAPAMSDFMKFVDGTLDALNTTVNDADKYNRFKTKALGPQASPEMITELETRIQSYIKWRTDIQSKNGNIGTEAYGYGRLDAVGHILSKTSLKTKLNDSVSDPEQWKSDAPVSYPHIWNASQQAIVQWNGLTSNSANPVKTTNIWTGVVKDTDVGALGRNVGEVTGVFADFETSTKNDGKSYKVKSSANVGNLIDLEQTLSWVPSPQWPFGPQDASLVSRGADLYKENCESCHSLLPHDDVRTKLPEFDPSINKQKVSMSWIHDAGTDIWMACNADQYGLDRSPNGTLVNPDQRAELSGAYQLTKVVTASVLNQVKGLIKSILNDTFGRGGANEYSKTKEKILTEFEVGFPIDPSIPHRKIEAALDCFNKSEIGQEKNVIDDYAEKKAVWKDLNFIQRLFAPGRKKKYENAKALNEKYRLLRYKARPLNGIWATAPYLHNGSVPTLEALLLPSKHTDSAGIAQYFQMQYIDEDSEPRLHSLKAALEKNQVPASYTGPYRPDCFYVGNLEYDTERAGYVSHIGSKGQSCQSGHKDPSERYFQLNVVDQAGNVIPGNSNAGHNYPKMPLPEDDRKALLEFLKTL